MVGDVKFGFGEGLRRLYRDMGDGTHAEVVAIGAGGGAAGGALPVSIQSQQAGERNVASAGNSYMVNRTETNGTIVTGSISAVQVSGGQPAHLVRCMPVNTALAGSVTIDGLTDQLGNPVSVVIPIGAAAFTPIEFSWARCENKLQVTLSNAADKVLFNWRPI